MSSHHRVRRLLAEGSGGRGDRRAIVAPSLLAGDSADLARAVATAEAAGADWLHVDVMDGVFVPPITFGAQTVAALRARTELALDVHLMTIHPERHIEAFAAAGADVITVHLEAVSHPHRTLQAIRATGAAAGLALVPSTPVAQVEELFNSLDLLLVMTVNPGYGGQQLIPRCLDKVSEAAAARKRAAAAFLIEVDGGINTGNAAGARAAGADVLVVGSAFYGAVAAAGGRAAAGAGAASERAAGGVGDRGAVGSGDRAGSGAAGGAEDGAGAAPGDADAAAAGAVAAGAAADVAADVAAADAAADAPGAAVIARLRGDPGGDARA